MTPQKRQTLWKKLNVLFITGFDSTPFTETGDLINFYNHIYVQVMKDVIAGFAATSKPVSYVCCFFYQ